MINSNLAYNQKLFKELKNITGLKNSTFRNMMYLLYSGYIHVIACESLDNEEGRIKTVTLELFNVCTMTLDVSDLDDIKVSSVKLLKNFKSDISRAVSEGYSPLEEMITEKFINNIKTKYENNM